MPLPRTNLALPLVVAICGCMQLNFLKPPAVPKPKGSSSTERGPAFANGAPAAIAQDTSGDWLTYNRTLRGDRYAPQAEITVDNAASLRRVCVFELGERATFQSGPVVVDGTMYVTTAKRTYAFDAGTCRLRWKHTYDYHPAPDFDLKVNRGVAFEGGRLFRGANDGRVYALDAATGKELWNVVAADVEKGETFPAAPVAWDGRVYIGNAGGDNFGVVGRMMAFDATTGGRLWTFDLIPRTGEAAATWPPETELIPRGGAASWTSYAIDTLSGSVFVPTGNAAPDFLGDARPGTNLYANSVVELDLVTGTLRGWHQLLERDVHDWDVAAAPSLIVTRTARRLIVAAGKDGYVYGIDREAGRIAYRSLVTRQENVDAPLTRAGTRFCPGVNGGVEWNGPTYSPRDDALYVNSIDWCYTVKVKPVQELRGKDAIPWTGSAKLSEPFGAPDSVWGGYITSLSAEDGKIRWQRRVQTPMVAGVTATAGGLVLTGDLQGNFLALAADDGRIVFSDTTGQPIGGGVVSYSVAGKQHVAVATGMHAPLTWRLESTPARVIVYALP